MELQGVRYEGRGLYKEPFETRIPGSYEFYYLGEIVGGLNFICPCGCGAFVSLPLRVNKDPRRPQAWDFDGNEEAPSICPAIHNMPCGWHGFFHEGIWRRARA